MATIGILLLFVQMVTPLPGGDDVTTRQAALCHDRYGSLPQDLFTRRSCAMCYVHLFPGHRLTIDRSFQSLVVKAYTGVNQTAHRMEKIEPNPDNPTSMEWVCKTLGTAEMCNRWTACCHSAVSCCQHQMTQSQPLPVPGADGGCARTWDGYSCWDDTAGGDTVYTACPAFMAHSITTNRAIKKCHENGTWFSKQGLSWTDYRPCLDKEGLMAGVYLCISCYILSILVLIPATVIFCAYRELSHQHRIRLHINFFISLTLEAVCGLLWYQFVHRELLTNPKNTATVIYTNPVWCRVLSFFKLYFKSTNYFWMFCEGYYLHRLISQAFETPKSLLTLYVTGWVVPVLPSFIYSMVRFTNANEQCWAVSFGHTMWIVYCLNLLCLLLNMLFLCNILRILLFQMHSHPHEPTNFRRGLKAVTMLIPLFGLQLAFIVYRPPAGSPGHKQYEYVYFVLDTSVGIFVSLIFCFFNSEVLSLLHRSFPSCCCCLRSIGRSRSHSNHCTQVTTMGDVGRSPTNSIHSQDSVSPKRNGRLAVDRGGGGGGGEAIDMQDLAGRDSRTSSWDSQRAVSAAADGGGRGGGYTPLPTRGDGAKV